MKWLCFQLDTTTAAVDLVSEMLSELSVEGIEIIDKVPLSEEDRQRMFIDILPELPEDDGTAAVRFYMDMDTDIGEFKKKVAEGLKDLSDFVDIGSGELTVSETEDKDWINNWKEFFKPFRVDDTIVIKPTWEELSEKKDTDLVIEIDPGTAFGTGAHETTKLCILNLKKYLTKGARVLDVGCGSGILSIVARKLGAAYAAAVDIDPIAVDVTVENAAVNELTAAKINKEGGENFSGKEGIIEVSAGNAIADEALRKEIGLQSFDVVVANILADVIIPLSSVVKDFMKPGSLFISSGIINTKKDAVLAAIRENGLEAVEVTTMKDWVSIIAMRME